MSGLNPVETRLGSNNRAMRNLIASDTIKSSTGIQTYSSRISVPRFRRSGECYIELVNVARNYCNWCDLVPFIRRIITIMRLLHEDYRGDAL
jgi:hypothetical protein